MFYRPPNSDAAYLSSIEDSIGFAADSGISEIIVTGDFNLNLFNPATSRKIHLLYYSLFQSIDKPTHFAENSSSLIDLLLTMDKDKDYLIHSGTGDPFLNQEV